VAVAGLAVPATAPASQPTPDDAAARVRRDKCGPLIAKPQGGTWSCTFVDNFGRGALNTTKWITQRTSETGFRTERTCYTGSPDNLAVTDGTLVLSARKGRWVNCRFMGRWLRTRFTGGMIGTRDQFSQTYGRFEVRAKFPAGEHAGIHGGFWMYPVDDTYGDWPASGEIDVAEWWSYEPTLVLPSLHFNGRDPDVDSGWDCKVEDASEFHTYTVVWRPQVIAFAIDGTTCFTRSWTPDSPQQRPQPFDHRFRMILNMGVAMNGLSWRTQFPASLVVDYAKAWR
jgi:beta-glucanase (GH16 family)